MGQGKQILKYGLSFLKAEAENLIGIYGVFWDPMQENCIIGKHPYFTFQLFPKGGADGPDGWEIQAILHGGGSIWRKFGREKDAKKWANSLLGLDKESLAKLFSEDQF